MSENIVTAVERWIATIIGSNLLDTTKIPIVI
jgi:hypothetical protein